MADEVKKKNGCLIGCGTVIGIVVVAIILLIIVIRVNGEAILRSVLTETNAKMGYYLTEDHSNTEREAFLNAFTEFVGDLHASTLQQDLQRHQAAVLELQTILRDRRITRSESAKWIGIFKQPTTEQVPPAVLASQPT